MPTGRQLHIDTPLSNMAVKAFGGRDKYIADQVFPVVPVAKQSNGYYVLTPASWLRTPTTLRAPKTKARRIEFDVSTDTYFAKNYALAGDIALEDLANADDPVRIRENTVNVVLDGLLRDWEYRLVQKIITSGNVGTATTLTNSNKWSAVDYANPVGQIMSAQAFIAGQTGLLGNTLIVDYLSYGLLSLNKYMLDTTRYVSAGVLTDVQIRALLAPFGIERILIGRGVYNSAIEGATASVKPIWSNSGTAGFAIVARLDQAPSLETATWGLSMRWQPEGFPAPLTVGRQQFAGPGTENIEVVEAQYWQDEKVVAPTLAYALWATNV